MPFAHGTTMNLTLPQWIACFVLDLLIKSFLVTAFGILVTLSAAPWMVTLVVANVAFLSLCSMLVGPNPNGVDADTHAAADWGMGAVLVGSNLLPSIGRNRAFQGKC